MKSKDQIQSKASRGGQKILRATGQDKSSYGETSARNINHTMKGGVSDISSSIKDGRVRSY